MEIIQSGNNVADDLKKVFCKFFDPEKNYLEKCRQLLKKVMVNKITATTGELAMLTSWRYFLSFVTDYFPSCAEDVSTRKTVVDICMEGLETYFKEPNNTDILKLWVESYMICVCAWKGSCLPAPEIVISRFSTILEAIRNEPSILEPPNLWKASFHCSLLHTIIPLKDYIGDNFSACATFMKHLQVHLFAEYNAVRLDQLLENLESNLDNWLLVLSICIRVYSFKNLDDSWYFSHDFEIRTWYFAVELMRSPTTWKIAKVAIKALKAFTLSTDENSFPDISFKKCGEQILPQNFSIDIDALMEKVISR